MHPGAEPPSATRAGPIARFHYEPPVLLTGQGSVGTLGDELADQGIETVFVVCNPSVGDDDAVMDLVLEGLGDRCRGVFNDATADKRLRTAWRAARQASEVGAEGIVGVGAGSALDTATVAAALIDRDGSFDTLASRFLETRRVPLTTRPRPLVTVPTTLAGAELSQGAGITADQPGEDATPVTGGVSDPSLMPMVTVHDAELVVHTPTGVLRRSSMNGFNKGVESIYTPSATPVTDATASRGLDLLYRWLPTLADDDPGVGEVDAILEGSLLVQYGASRPTATGLSIIHAFGHGVTAHTPVQQGVAHAVLTPNILRALFAQAPCRGGMLADALGVADTTAVVDAVAGLRDVLGLPDRLGDLEGVTHEDLGPIAAATADDRLMDNLPDGVSFGVRDLKRILESAW